MTTRLGLYGGARQPAGSFAGKVALGVTKGTVTKLGLYGGTRQLQGSYLGKVEDGTVVTKPRLTRLGLYGGTRPLYSTFTGKLEQEADEQVRGGGKDKLSTSQKKLRRFVDKVHLEEILPEDITGTTKEALLTGKVEVNGTEVIVENLPIPPVLALAPIPSLSEQIGSLERVIEEDIQREMILKQAQAIQEFQEDVRKFEEEFLMLLILICD